MYKIVIWVAVLIIVFIWSAIEPKDRLTWFLEVFSVIIGSVVLAFSAFYELLEWWVALFSEEATEAFLGMQGYEWDTQSDIAYALIAAIAAWALLSNWHDRQLKNFQ
jgi:putative membrane protein